MSWGLEEGLAGGLVKGGGSPGAIGPQWGLECPAMRGMVTPVEGVFAAGGRPCTVACTIRRSRQRADGQWVVECPECQAPGEVPVPIGIGLPLQSEYVAEMLRENHLRRGRVA